ALGDFDKLSRQPLRGNVVLAKNTQRCTQLTFIEVQFFLEQSDILSLLSGQVLQRAFRIANKLIHFLLWDADNNRRASDTAANRDATSIRPDLSVRSGNRREEAHTQYCNEAQMLLHGGGTSFRFRCAIRIGRAARRDGRAGHVAANGDATTVCLYAGR